MAKVPYRSREDAAGADQELYDRLEAERPVPTAHIFLALAHAPEQLNAFLDYANSLRSCELDRRMRELLVLTIGHAVGSSYEVAHHEPYALAAGLSPEQISAVPVAEESGLFDENDMALIRLGRAFCAGELSQPDWDRLAARLSTRQMVQLALTAAWYLSGAQLMRILDLDLEAHYLKPTVPDA